MRGPWALLGLVCLCLGACRRVPTEAPEGGDDPAALAIWIDADGPWRELPADQPRPIEVPAPVAVPRPAPSTKRRPSLTLPARRRSPGPTAAAPLSPDQARRERYVANPTRIRAARITLYCSAAYAREASLTGAEIDDARPGRRVARGGARLRLRELTLEAERITLRIRPAAEMDIRITASGNVAFVTDQRGRVMHDEGIRILMIRNEQITPLR